MVSLGDAFSSARWRRNWPNASVGNVKDLNWLPPNNSLERTGDAAAKARENGDPSS